MRNIIERARLTDEEITAALDALPITVGWARQDDVWAALLEAQLAKALWAVVEWLKPAIDRDYPASPSFALQCALDACGLKGPTVEGKLFSAGHRVWDAKGNGHWVYDEDAEAQKG